MVGPSTALHVAHVRTLPCAQPGSRRQARPRWQTATPAGRPAWRRLPGPCPRRPNAARRLLRHQWRQRLHLAGCQSPAPGAGLRWPAPGCRHLRRGPRWPAALPRCRDSFSRSAWRITRQRRRQSLPRRRSPLAVARCSARRGAQRMRTGGMMLATCRHRPSGRLTPSTQASKPPLRCWGRSSRCPALRTSWGAAPARSCSSRRVRRPAMPAGPACRRRSRTPPTAGGSTAWPCCSTWSCVDLLPVEWGLGNRRPLRTVGQCNVSRGRAVAGAQNTEGKKKGKGATANTRHRNIAAVKSRC